MGINSLCNNAVVKSASEHYSYIMRCFTLGIRSAVDKGQTEKYEIWHKNERKFWAKAKWFWCEITVNCFFLFSFWTYFGHWDCWHPFFFFNDLGEPAFRISTWQFVLHFDSLPLSLSYDSHSHSPTLISLRKMPSRMFFRTLILCKRRYL